MHRPFLVILALLGLLVAAPAQATSVVELPLPQHVAESTAVVEATVGVPHVTVNEETQRPLTHTPLTVTGVLAGSAPAQLEISQHKGRVGDRELFFPGDGELEPGSTVIVFVIQAEGRWWLTALAQSVWTIDGTGDDAPATRQLADLAFYERNEAGKVVPASKPVQSRTTLGALRAAITAAKGN